MKFTKYINLRSNAIIVMLALCSLACLFVVENSKTLQRSKWYDEKLQAAQLSQKAQQTVKKYFYRDAEFIDNVNDPNETGLIGDEYSPITSERGSYVAKSASTNPNFAALVVEYLKELDLKEGDNVAVGLTSSFPALNISVCAALQTLKLKPVIISSVSSSSWGATNPAYTWLDMAHVLNDSGIIVNHTKAASIGAGMDIGRGLSNDGVNMIFEAIKRNNLDLIYFDTIQQSINQRLKIYDSIGGPIKVYINVGGGIASLGSASNGNLIPPGLNKHLTLDVFKDKKGVVYEMAKRSIPVIHMLNIDELTSQYDFPKHLIPMPLPGQGKLFEIKKYNLNVVIPITVLLLVIIILVIYYDKKNARLGADVLRSESNEEEIIL